MCGESKYTLFVSDSGSSRKLLMKDHETDVPLSEYNENVMLSGKEDLTKRQRMKRR